MNRIELTEAEHAVLFRISMLKLQHGGKVPFDTEWTKSENEILQQLSKRRILYGYDLPVNFYAMNEVVIL